MATNINLQAGMNQLNSLMQILNNPQSFMQQFMSALNNPTLGQQLNTGLMQSMGFNPQVNMPQTAPSTTPPQGSNALGAIGNSMSAADRSVQYTNMQVQRDISASQNMDDAVDGMKTAWDNFKQGNWSDSFNAVKDAGANAIDAGMDQIKSIEYGMEAHEQADIAGAQASIAGQRALTLMSPNLAQSVSSLATSAGLSGQNVTSQLKNYNESLNSAVDSGQSSWLAQKL